MCPLTMPDVDPPRKPAASTPAPAGAGRPVRAPAGKAKAASDDPFGLVNAPLSAPAKPVAGGRPGKPRKADADPFGLVNTPLAPPSDPPHASGDAAAATPPAPADAAVHTVPAAASPSALARWRKLPRTWRLGLALAPVAALLIAVIGSFFGGPDPEPELSLIRERLAGLIERPGWEVLAVSAEVEARRGPRLTLTFTVSTALTEPLYLPVNTEDFLRDTLGLDPGETVRMWRELTETGSEIAEESVAAASALVAARILRSSTPAGSLHGYHGVMDAERVGRRWRLEVLSIEADAPPPPGRLRAAYAGRTFDLENGDDLAALREVALAGTAALARIEETRWPSEVASAAPAVPAAPSHPGEPEPAGETPPASAPAPALASASPGAPAGVSMDESDDALGYDVGPELGAPGGDSEEAFAAVQVFDLTELDQPPVPLRQSVPPRPAALGDEPTPGRVVLVFFVDEKGRVRVPRGLEATRPEFLQTSIDTIRLWRFEPGRKDGRAVMTRLTHVFEFEPPS